MYLEGGEGGYQRSIVLTTIAIKNQIINSNLHYGRECNSIFQRGDLDGLLCPSARPFVSLKQSLTHEF